MNKFAEPLPYADPKAAPRKVLRSPTARRGLDSRLFIEKLNSPMLTKRCFAHRVGCRHRLTSISPI
jgi:hypothetical protein